MPFELEDKFYEMYKIYVDKIGFSIRMSKTKCFQDDTIYQKYIEDCSYSP
jgi:hypothetical protein